MNDAPDPSTEIVRFAHEFSDALERHDQPAVERLLSGEFTYTTASGQVLDRAGFVERFVCAPGVRWERHRLDRITVKPLGSYFVLTCRVHGAAWVDGTRLAARLSSTYLYARTDAGWRCVAGHSRSFPATEKTVEGQVVDG